LKELGHVAQQTHPHHVVEKTFGPAAQSTPAGSSPQVALVVEPVAEGYTQSAAVQEAENARGCFQEVQGLR